MTEKNQTEKNWERQQRENPHLWKEPELRDPDLYAVWRHGYDAGVAACDAQWEAGHKQDIGWKSALSAIKARIEHLAKGGEE